METNDQWDGVDRRRADDPILDITGDIVAAHVSNNTVAIADIPQLIANVYGALSTVTPVGAVEEKPVPKVPVRTSVKPDYIVCLECGDRLKMLKRHLWTHHQTTVEDYRARWKLAKDYPMVAPNYAEQRRSLAKSIGLGTKRRKTGKGAATK